MSEEKSIYLNVVTRINADYADLIRHLQEMDLRVAYLQTFELSLSSALPESLWETPAYIAQQSRTPMPSNPYELLDFQTFRGWMTVYEIVMRDAGLIGTRDVFIEGLDDVDQEARE